LSPRPRFKGKRSAAEYGGGFKEEHSAAEYGGG
jgi:hypothetical protein